MKQLEQGISTLQASVEKSTTHTVDAVVKTAAETAANVYRSMLPVPSLSDKPQFDIICDGCYTPIRGQRWRCETCDDFDLCSTCKSRVNHNPQHNFRFITSSSPSPPQQKTQPQPFVNMNYDERCSSSSQSEPSQTIFICDYCDNDIVGIRHSCAVCPDFDLCHSCFSIVKENHPEHIFVTRLVGTQASKKPKNKKEAKIFNPSTTSTTTVDSPQPSHDANNTHASILHLGVYCDNCQTEITGIRFKCGHCPNYDLCQICEEYAPNLHNEAHAFIKIRYPIKSLAKRPILPTFSPLIVKPSLNNNDQTPKEEKTVDHDASSKTTTAVATVATTTMATPTIAATTNISSTISSSSSSSNSSIGSEDNESSRSIPKSDKSIPSSASVISIPNSPFITGTKDTVTPTEDNDEEPFSARFVSDLNIPDGTLVVPNKSFIKMWKVVNNGNVDWPVGTHLLFNGGSILRPYPVTKPNTFTVPVTAPKEEACISAELQAPDCPGEYSSYFCLCTPDGVRFGDSLWCTIRVDLDEEPDHISVRTATTSPEDIMMNSSNSMIYPTVSSVHEDIQQQQSHEEDGALSHDGYTDHDDYSEFTNDHHSTLTSEAATIRTDSDSHMSSPASSELDIGDHYRGDLFSTEEEYEEDNRVDEQVSYTYQVISPSASTILPNESDTKPTVAIVNDDDDFVIIDERGEDEQTVEIKNEDEVSSNESNSLNSSVLTITITPANTNTRPTIHDGTYYRSQLLQLHEMGFTSYDDLAISLLNLHDGNVDDVIAKLLYYP
ncbi:unnamed protein product [Mucor hiemalis]